MTTPLNDAQKKALTRIFNDAVYEKKYEMADATLAKGASFGTIDKDSGGNLIHKHLWQKDLKQLEYLYKVGVGLDDKDNEGFTPLHRYITGSDVRESIVKFFLDRGADALAQNKAGSVLMGDLQDKISRNGFTQEGKDLERIMMMLLQAKPDPALMRKDPSQDTDVDVAVPENTTITAPRIAVPKPSHPKN